MYDIRQFKPSLYVLLIMGITGYALAAQSPGVWLGAVAAIALNGWLLTTGRFRPLPRLIANTITVLATIYAFMSFNRAGTSGILVIGEFLVFLQLVKLFEQRGNRDFAQLLVLSLLLMVAASINTASLAFGVLLIAYLFLSLYCCLLFHLKVETDHARTAIGLPENKLNPMTLRQDQRYLARSMRRLTALVSAAAITMAVLVFLFFPRMTGAGFLGPLSAKPAQTLTGFSEHVGFQQVAQITQNAEIVAYAKVEHNARPVEGTETLLMRGISLNVYTGNDPHSPPWQWLRTSATSATLDLDQVNRTIQFDSPPADSDQWKQSITLLPSGSRCIFALGGVVSVRPGSMMDGKLQYDARDQSLQLDPAIDKRVQYDVVSSGKLKGPRERPETPTREPSDDERNSRDPKLSRSVIDPQIETFARRSNVSGTDSAGPLERQRDKNAFTTRFDETIAGNIERYLHSQGGFTYTLDLTDAKGIGDRDPMVAFLYDLKRGHCEYFAGAMTLMCQSLGIQARVVVGFKVDGSDYNNLTHSYVVRQNQAHAWVEVLNDRGEWLTFDPTTGSEAAQSNANSMWRKVKQVFDYLDYTWANSVVAYDRESRNSLIANVETKLTDTASTGNDQARSAKDRLASMFSLQNYFLFSSRLLTVLITALILICLAAVGWFFFERWRIRRRARRIGLNALPPDAQLRMARQLGFYDELLTLLAGYGITAKPSQTPLEFSRSVSFLPNELFDAVYRLTEIFYQVRFGRVSLSSAQQRHLNNVIARIETGLGGMKMKRR